MTTEGWIFMVGFRVFDVGLLVLWMIWFFRLRDDGEDPPDEDGGGGGGPDPAPASGPDGGGLGAPLGRVRSGGPRIRDHAPLRPRRRGRGDESPVPRPLPARVRLPRSPDPVHRHGQSV